MKQFRPATETHPLYEGIERMVLWGEKCEAVMDRLRVNGVEGAEAEALYSAAHLVRVNAFRQVFRKRIGVGLLLILVGIGVVAGCWFGLGFILRNVFIVCALLVGIGLWKLINGLLGYTTAGRREGSLADDF